MNENLDKSDGLCTQRKTENGGCKPLWWMKTSVSQNGLHSQKKQEMWMQIILMNKEPWLFGWAFTLEKKRLYFEGKETLEILIYN